MGLRGLLSDEGDPGCECQPRFEGDRLVVDASSCDGSGQLERATDCRATVIAALDGQDAETVLTRAGGVERAYTGAAAALLVAAGRFVDAVGVHDDRLAARARTDPLGAAREATGRADATAAVAAETGLAELAAAARDTEAALAPVEGLTVSRWRVDRGVPDAALDTVRELETGGTVRQYRAEEGRRYHLDPVDQQLDDEEAALLAAATEQVASTAADGATPRDAVETVANGVLGRTVERVVAVLEKHTRRYGLLSELFADPAVSDVYVTAPAAGNPVRVVADGQAMRTNLRLTDDGVDALASRFRRESGRAFSRAAPTLDAAVEVGGRQVRVAGLRPPVSDGLAFAFRAHDQDTWQLDDLVANGTVTAEVAALLWLCVERGRSVLLAGARGAGKTTMLGALLWELPADVRTVTIEDTPELPVSALQAAGRDVQRLRTGSDGGEIPLPEALRTALRLGDGALVVGEVRGGEASVLYEAMRVGATGEAVLGTVHGDGATAVYERVVEDLGVAPAAFGATDLVVTLETTADGRRVSRVEEVTDRDPPTFESLYAVDGGGLSSTGRVERGNSRLVAGLARPGETYESVNNRVQERTERVSDRLTGVAGSRPWD